MQFKEFINRNKNVLQHSSVKRINTSIPISEERDAFYTGELFKKYDIVESNGVQYTVLEQASNYYQVVDGSGNICKKFAKQLNHTDGELNLSYDVFHGYQIQTEEARKWLHSNFFIEAIDNDDVYILKHLKQLDEQMDEYKSKDKLTVAKIIADTVGVPHDAISSPDNLVAAAIRKAKKDPALMKNKAILQNMIQIAKDVGIRVTDTSFDVNESELDESYAKHAGTAAVYDKEMKFNKPEDRAAMATNAIKYHTRAMNLAPDDKKKQFHKSRIDALSVKESEELDEGKFDDVVKGIKRKIAGKQDPKEVQYQHGFRARQAIDASRKFNNQAAYDNEEKMVDRYNKVHKIVNKNVSEEAKPVNTTSSSGKKLVSAFDVLTHAKKIATAEHDGKGKVLVSKDHIARARVHLLGEETLEELSVNTLKSYAGKAREDAVKSTAKGAKAKKLETAYSHMKKASTRLNGAAKADKKAFAADWKQRTGQNESVDDLDEGIQDDKDGMTFKDLKKRLNGGEHQQATNEPKPEVSAPTDTLPHGKSMSGDRSEHVRRAIIKKIQGT